MSLTATPSLSGIPAGVIFHEVDRIRCGHRLRRASDGVRRRGAPGYEEELVSGVARLDPQKGLRYLIEAMPALLREVPGVVLMFAGDGPPAARPALVSLAETLRVGSQVRFLGVQADVRPYLELCDAFVLPSLYEGMGISLVEAMAMERACVATSTTAVPEVVADGLSGFLVAPANPSVLAAAIARLLRDPVLRARMGTEGRRIALERFDVSRNIGQLESVYSQVARHSAAA